MGTTQSREESANRSDEQSTMTRKESPGPTPPFLCDFCRPRLDLAKLGWIKKTEPDGSVFLEPRTIVNSYGSSHLAPHVDLRAFRSATLAPPSLKHLGELPDEFKGVHYQEDLINVEYLKEDSFPSLPALTKSAETGCVFCELVRKLLAEQADSFRDQGDGTVVVWNIQFAFSKQSERERALVGPKCEPRMVPFSLRLYFQPAGGYIEQTQKLILSSIPGVLKFSFVPLRRNVEFNQMQDHSQRRP
jgi:hypothetical protein